MSRHGEAALASHPDKAYVKYITQGFREGLGNVGQPHLGQL